MSGILVLHPLFLSCLSVCFRPEEEDHSVLETSLINLISLVFRERCPKNDLYG